MAKNVRIIPRLDIKGPDLVKGVHLEGLRALGKPEQYARYYYEQGADELIYMDIVASLYNRNSLHDIITKTAREIFIPLTVGGGLRTIDDIRTVLRAGADKVALNTAAIRNPDIIREASRMFGSSTIVITIEAIRQDSGNYLAYTDNGREYTGINAIDWSRRAEELGAGEILITSVDREGTGKGYDIELIRQVSSAVSIPVVAHGGGGTLSHIAECLGDGCADAVAISSMLHYGLIKEYSSDYTTGVEGNTEFLKKGISFSKVQPTNLDTIKSYLAERGVICRPHKVAKKAVGSES
jgi:cyclase